MTKFLKFLKIAYIASPPNVFKTSEIDEDEFQQPLLASTLKVQEKINRSKK